MNIEKIKELCVSGRIPLEYRTDKSKGIELLNIIKENNIEILNNDIYSLCNWLNYDLQKYKSNENFAIVKNIKILDPEKTVDLSINDGHSYTSNGIICHNTINLPNDVTIESVSEIYFNGWEHGLKGVTIYRDGSRSGVLVSKEENKEVKKNPYYGDSDAPKRPKSLPCDVFKFTNKGEKWIGFIGLYKNGDDEYRPYEVFTGLADSFNVPGYVEKGDIVKIKEGGISRYDFIYKDKDGFPVIMTGLNRSFNREFWNIGKMMSAILRHRMPIKNVIDLIDSLKLTDDSLVTWKNGVKRMMKKYIKEEQLVGEPCPNCGSMNYVHEAGCDICKDCGTSQHCN